MNFTVLFQKVLRLLIVTLPPFLIWTIYLNSLHRDYFKLSMNSSFDRFVITCYRLPNDTRFYPTVSNGFIGYKLFNNTLYRNGLYNGRKALSHRAKIPVKVPNLLLKTFHPLTSKYTQNMRKGIFTSVHSNDFTVFEQTVYAHRLYTRLLVFEVVLESKLKETLKIFLGKASVQSSDDITFQYPRPMQYSPSLCNRTDECKFVLQASFTVGHTNIKEEVFSKKQNIAMIASDIPPVLTVNKHARVKHVFLISIASTLAEADFFYRKGLESVCSGQLMHTHAEEWNNTWKSGDIKIYGDMQIEQSITSSLYFILSSFPPLNMKQSFPFAFYGASPGGLPHGGAADAYFGHVFWDQDFWMVPGLLPFFPELAKLVIGYRIRNLLAGCMKARSLGYHGATYPWESAYTGFDVCPGNSYITEEIHVTGDIIHLLKQYIYYTDDWNIFSEEIVSCNKNFSNNSFSSTLMKEKKVSEYKTLSQTRSNHQQVCHSICESKIMPHCRLVSAWDMLRETSNFWLSRVEWSPAHLKYVINHVMGPDEWHAPVNNSVYTNVIAMQSLHFAYDVASHLGVCSEVSRQWKHVADNMFVAISTSELYHPEYEGYDKEMVKQADAILLGFPLLVSNQTLMRNDLIFYENFTTDSGPAMTWGMFAINWLALREEDRARPMFLRQLQNIQPPFNIWSEQADGSGATNFLTGMGGFVQSVLYGYFGIRAGQNELIIDPQMLPSSVGGTVQKMSLSGLNYQNSLLNITCTCRNITITYLGNDKALLKNVCVKIYVSLSGHSFTLCHPGYSIVVHRCRIFIKIINEK